QLAVLDAEKAQAVFLPSARKRDANADGAGVDLAARRGREESESARQRETGSVGAGRQASALAGHRLRAAVAHVPDTQHAVRLLETACDKLALGDLINRRVVVK